MVSISNHGYKIGNFRTNSSNDFYWNGPNQIQVYCWPTLEEMLDLQTIHQRRNPNWGKTRMQKYSSCWIPGKYFIVCTHMKVVLCFCLNWKVESNCDNGIEWSGSFRECSVTLLNATIGEDEKWNCKMEEELFIGTPMNNSTKLTLTINFIGRSLSDNIHC